MSLQMPLHLNCHAKSEPCSPSSLSVSPRCFISESIQCIDKIEQMSSEELETKFHAWLNVRIFSEIWLIALKIANLHYKRSQVGVHNTLATFETEWFPIPKRH